MKAKDKVIRAFLQKQKKQLYFKELKDATKLSNSSLQNIIEELTSKNYLSINKTKAHTFYEIKDFLKFAIEFSNIAVHMFENLNRGIRIPLTNFIEKYPKNTDIIILFGSASRKKEKDGSDIDLLITYSEESSYEAIQKEVNAVSNYPLSIFNCSYQDFLKNDDQVIIQAKKTGFPIKGHQQFYEVILHEFS